MSTFYKRDIIFLVSILFLSMIAISNSRADAHSSKKNIEVEKLKNKDKHTKSRNQTSHRKQTHVVESVKPKPMTISNNFQIRGNITSAKIKTKNIIITGQAIIAKTSTAKDVEADKIAVQTIYVSEIYSPNGVITLSGNLVINNNIAADAAVAAKSFIVQGVKQWYLKHYDDFDTEHSLGGWSSNQTSNCHNNKFLGGHCQFSFNEASKQYDSLPSHSHLRINALVHMFDNWNGENAYLKVDDKIMWKKVGKNSKNSGNNHCGGASNDPAYALPVDIVIPHNSSNVTLTFGSTLKKDPCEASFGVDDVMIYVK